MPGPRFEIAFKKKKFFNGMKYMHGVEKAMESTPETGIFEIVGTSKKNIQLVPDGMTYRDRFSINKDDITIIKKVKEGGT